MTTDAHIILILLVGTAAGYIIRWLHEQFQFDLKTLELWWTWRCLAVEAYLAVYMDDAVLAADIENQAHAAYNAYVKRANRLHCRLFES